MFRRRWLLILVVALMPLSSCTSGGECDRCDSDDDCNSGPVMPSHERASPSM